MLINIYKGLILTALLIQISFSSNIIADTKVRQYGTLKLIEYNYNGEWLPVCDSNITTDTLYSICRSLGVAMTTGTPVLLSGKECGTTQYYVQNELTSIIGHYGIDLNGSPSNGYTIRSCLRTENFSQCLDRYASKYWRQSDCTDNQCFSVECEEDTPQDEEEQKYGKVTGSPKIGDVKLTSKQHLYYYTGKYFDPVCELNFDSDSADTACSELGYASGSFTKEVCSPPSNQGYRDKNFQIINCFSSEIELNRCSIMSSPTCNARVATAKSCVKLKCSGTRIVSNSILSTVLSVLLFAAIIGYIGYAQAKKRRQQHQRRIQQQQQQAQQQQQQQADPQQFNQNQNQNIGDQLTSKPEDQTIQQLSAVNNQEKPILQSQQYQQTPGYDNNGMFYQQQQPYLQDPLVMQQQQMHQQFNQPIQPMQPMQPMQQMPMYGGQMQPMGYGQQQQMQPMPVVGGVVAQQFDVNGQPIQQPPMQYGGPDQGLHQPPPAPI